MNNEERKTLLNGEVLINDINKKKNYLKKLKKALALTGLTMGITVSSTMIQGNNTTKDSRVVDYVNPTATTDFVVPSGYALTYDKEGNKIGIKTINTTSKTLINEDGTKEIRYVIPSGYVLTHDENGNYIGQKIIKAEEKVTYSIPSGYTLTHDKNGKLVGKKVTTMNDDKKLSLKK